jgi:hypothetical protein
MVAARKVRTKGAKRRAGSTASAAGGRGEAKKGRKPKRGRRAARPAQARAIAELPSEVQRALDVRVRAMAPPAPYALSQQTQARLRASVMDRIPDTPDDPRYAARPRREK